MGQYIHLQIFFHSLADDPNPAYQYWLGARDFRFHNDHIPGDWHWDTK